MYESYPAAVWAMLKTLTNPRVGAQWFAVRPPAAPALPNDDAHVGEQPPPLLG